MGKKIFFQDGSAIEIATEIIEPGEMATAAYRKVMEFLEDEIVEGADVGEGVEDLGEEDFEELDEDELSLDLDDEEDEEELALDDDWDDKDDFEDRW